jgi:hypothetical protein
MTLVAIMTLGQGYVRIAMRRKGTPKSVTQQWVSERCFSSYGSLEGIVTRLRQIANNRSTLISERDTLLAMVDTLRIFIASWNSDNAKDRSLAQYKERN